jgi:hypothetical protein
MFKLLNFGLYANVEIKHHGCSLCEKWIVSDGALVFIQNSVEEMFL